jgi:hypothetical protein
MDISEIQTKIGELFNKYNIPAITLNMPMENLHKWSSQVAAHFKLDVEKFSQVMSELFWSAAHIQLSLGYALIARQDCKFPKGINGKAFKEEDMPNAIVLPEIHFWYHLYNTYECIYRSWERITTVIKSVCYPNLSEKIYFDQIINKLDNDSNFKNNPHLKALKKQIKHWNKIAESRNEISHGKSSPFRNMNIEGKVSDVLGIDGLPLIYLDYSIKSPKESIEQVVDKYKKVFPAMKTTVDFIDNIDR